MDSETSYDSLHFAAQPSPERHPDRIAAAAMLYGHIPVLPDSARILEIGCGTGANIIPIAEMYPNSRCLGIDLASSQIDVGKHALKELELKNCELRVLDISRLEEDLGEFDYVLCHGVFSWVSPQVREALVKIIGSVLANNGLASLSFLGKPAWGIRGSVYEQIQAQDNCSTAPEERIVAVRDLCSDFEAKQIDDYTSYGMLLRSELETIAKQSDALIFHELLNAHTQAFSVKEFTTLLGSAELRYLTDAASYSRCLGSRLSEFNLNLEQKLPEIVDMLFPQKVHSSVICRSSFSLSNEPMAETLCRLFVSSPHVPSSTGDKKSPIFYAPGGAEFRCSSEAGIDILNTLADVWPSPVSVISLMKSLSGFAFRGKKLLRHEVLGEVGKLILDGVITPHTSRMGILETPPKKPKLRPYARFELQNQNWATNKRHEYSVFEGIERKIALLFDGTITEKEAIITVLGWFENGTLTIPEEISEDGNADGPDKIAVSLVAEVLDKLTMCAFL